MPERELARCRVLLLQLEVPLRASLAAGEIVRAKGGGTVILDPAPAPNAAFPAGASLPPSIS